MQWSSNAFHLIVYGETSSLFWEVIKVYHGRNKGVLLNKSCDVFVRAEAVPMKKRHLWSIEPCSKQLTSIFNITLPKYQLKNTKSSLLFFPCQILTAMIKYCTFHAFIYLNYYSIMGDENDLWPNFTAVFMS